MNIKAAITISRNSNDKVVIRVEDKTSTVEFLNLTLSLEDYAKAITGLGLVEASAVTRRLDAVGKEIERQRRSVECPIKFDKAAQKKWLIENCQEEGWEIDSYLGSKGSVGSNGENSILNYSVFRYVDSHPEEK